MTFDDRYASAVRSSNLRGKSDTQGAVDVLGAAGIAAKQAPLAIALERLLNGRSGSSREVVDMMCEAVISKAWLQDRCVLPRTEGADMARAVLAWYRDGACTSCGGHGVLTRRGAPSLSDQKCTACKGTGKVLFDRQFSMERLSLARWMLAELERELAKAGPLAMAALAPRLDL